MRYSIVFLTVFAAACGVQESYVGQNEGADLLADDAELSATSRTYVGLRRDYRRCLSPMCGGYWVHDLNRVTLNEVYVSGLDFTGSGLSDAEQGQVAAGLGEVVLRGKLGPIEKQFNTRPFIVSEAYRGLPGKEVGATQKFFKVKPASVQCLRAPCPTLGATRVNYTAQSYFHELSLSRAGEGRVDVKWLENRALNDGAIVGGALVKDGDETVLDAANVFVRLPEAMGPCPLVKQAPCATGKVRIYTRDQNRCIVPTQCVTPGACALWVPTCNEGYSLTSWTGGQFACSVSVCDPSWVVGDAE